MKDDRSTIRHQGFPAILHPKVQERREDAYKMTGELAPSVSVSSTHTMEPL